MVKIREANSLDIVGLRKLFKEWIATRKLFPPPANPLDITVFDECLQSSNQFCVVAEDEETGILVGYALCTFNYAVWLGKSVMLENIFVQEKYRLKGIGKRLLASILKHGLTKGCRNVNFYTEENDDCRGFFAKVGGRDITASEGWLVYTLPFESIRST